MRDYVSRIAKTAGDAVAYPRAARAILTKRPAYIAAAFLIALVAVFAVLRIVKTEGVSTPVNSEAVNKTTIETSTKTDPLGTDTAPQPVAVGGQAAMKSADSNDKNSSSSTQTDVTVNGQKVDVPQNGSVSKTIKSDNGTTSVNITNSSSSDGSSTTSNSLNVSTFSSSAGSSNVQINRHIP